MAPVTIERVTEKAPNLSRRNHQMKNSTARKLKQVPKGYLVMGIDPHKKRHAAVAMTQDFTTHSKFKFNNSKEGFEVALERVRADF